MAYKGDTVKFRISSPNVGKTVSTMEEVEPEIDRMVRDYGVDLVAVDRIETTRLFVRKTKGTK